MNKRAFISSLSALGFAQAANAEGVAQPGITPESCSYQSPEFMWETRVAAQPEGSSEQAQTRFFQSYAANLKHWTDLKHPAAKALRPHIERAFLAAMEFIVLEVWGGVAHVLTRLPAEIEWIIWHGFDRGFEEAYIGRYTHKTISDLLAAIFEANAEPYKKLTESKGIENCLNALNEAEKLLPEQGRNYFRSHLLKRIGRCL